MEQDFSEKFYNEADTTVTIRQIRKALRANIKRKFPENEKEWIDNITDEILKMNGIDFDHFNFIHQIEKVISEKLNDVSIDDNSNKNEKTIAGIFAEAVAPIKKVVGFDYLYRVMKEMYGKNKAKRLAATMYDYSIGLSDSTNILLPYCWAIDSSKLLTIGRDFGQLPSSPCHRISSYISALCETIHSFATHLAGACAIGDFFLCVSKLAYYNMNLDRENLDDPKCRKHFENEFQQFVHSVNHLSRNSNESPFTNVSVFDKVKLKFFVSEEVSWMFPKPENWNKTEEEWFDYITEYIYEIQNIFLDFFDKGDPLNDGRPYRFPVVTANFSKKQLENKKWKILDEEFLNNITSRDIYRYNIFMSEGTKIASCCRLVNNSNMLDIATQSNSFGSGALSSLGSHRVATINFNRIALECKNVKDFWKIYEKRVEDARDILIAHKTLLVKLSEKGLQPFIFNGWINIKRLFSTFGILGITECFDTLKRRFNIDYDIIEEILNYLTEKSKEYSSSTEGIVFNQEQIPAESFAVRLASIDKILFGEEKVPYELYGNQFIPLWKDATVWEKVDIDGKYNKLMTGGSLVHIQIGEKLTQIQAKKLINYTVNSGCEHFALNTIYSLCVDGHNSFGKYKLCPICGKPIKDYMTRVVGFFVPISSWNKTRREWEFDKRTFTKVE